MTQDENMSPWISVVVKVSHDDLGRMTADEIRDVFEALRMLQSAKTAATQRAKERTESVNIAFGGSR